MQSAQPERRAYSAGEKVPDPGIYRVVHYQHRMPHLVTISAANATFPFCRVCDHRVVFEPMFEVTGSHPATKAKDFAPDSVGDMDLRDRHPHG